MAAVSNRSKIFFRISPDTTNFCFALHRGDLKDRLDAKYFALRENLFSDKYPLQKLGILVIQEPDYGATSRAVPRTNQQQPRYIRITDFGDDGIDPNHEFLTADPIDLDYELAKDDILFARSGATVGKTYIHEDISEPAIFAGYCIRFKLNPNEVLPKFVYNFTKTDTYNRWVAAIQRPSGQPNINKEEFKNLEIPTPLITKQHELVAAMDEARSQRRQKLTEADALLSSLDEFILKALDINLPSPDNRKAYAICLSQMLGDRVDAYSNQPYFQKLFATIESSEHHVTTLGNLAEKIFSGTTPLAKGNAYVDPPNGVRFVRSGEITNEGRVTPKSEVHIREEIHNEKMKRSQLQPGDLLIAIVGATIGSVGIYDFDEPANINQAIAAVRLRFNNVLVEYVCWYLRCSLGQRLLDYFKRPVARANINLTEIGEIPIIIPSQEIQQNIIAEVQHRREEARRLRIEAETGWQKAKQWFEEQLLGSAPL